MHRCYIEFDDPICASVFNSEQDLVKGLIHLLCSMLMTEQTEEDFLRQRTNLINMLLSTLSDSEQRMERIQEVGEV